MNGMYEELPNSCDEQKRQSIEAVISAYKSILTPLSHISMPISSGKRYYDVISKNPYISQDQIYRDIIRYNAEQGIALSRAIVPKAKYPVVVPALFEAKEMRWTEEEYMYMWYNVIHEKALEIWMVPDWEYSDGCSEEFLKAIEMQEAGSSIVVFDFDGNHMDKYAGINLLYDAILDITERGFKCPKLENCHYSLIDK